MMFAEENTEQTVACLEQLAKDCMGVQVTGWEKLAQSGSCRRYFRLFLADTSTCIGAYNRDIAENRAFFSYTRDFSARHFRVPALLGVADDEQHYLQTDLGSQTLYDALCTDRHNGELSPQTIKYYEKTVAALPLLQLAGKQNLDFSVAYPRAAFDRQSMQWDLNYFKYYFLKLINIPFHEQSLENDYDTLIKYLLTADCHYFLYRDFQSRNIMIHADDVYFIDYQGGRQGALQYDIASLLYDAKADLPTSLRQHLLTLYIETLSHHIPVDHDRFLDYYQGYALIRILQSMGAYGYRGYFERKSHFLQSVPYAAHNLDDLLKHWHLPIVLPELTQVLKRLVESDFVRPYRPTAHLVVLIQSFSYRAGLPHDPTPNGGGHIFDCRALPNPGREKKFAHNTGKDNCIIDYFSHFQSIRQFLQHVFAIVDQSVDNYLQRQFDHLTVGFGCTGGQHRSVFMSEQLANHLRDRYPAVEIRVEHTELRKKF